MRRSSITLLDFFQANIPQGGRSVILDCGERDDFAYDWSFSDFLCVDLNVKSGQGSAEIGDRPEALQSFDWGYRMVTSGSPSACIHRIEI